jgi:hypothetical protein
MGDDILKKITDDWNSQISTSPSTLVKKIKSVGGESIEGDWYLVDRCIVNVKIANLLYSIPDLAWAILSEEGDLQLVDLPTAIAPDIVVKAVDLLKNHTTHENNINLELH